VALTGAVNSLGEWRYGRYPTDEFPAKWSSISMIPGGSGVEVVEERVSFHAFD
jgi:hypothetical protein